MRTVLLVLLALAAGFGLGMFVFSRLPVTESPNTLVGKYTVSEEELDSALGTYTYDGTTVSVTVRDAIEESSSLEAAKRSDGTYELPSADAVLAIARNNILLEEASARGISATDEDTLSYAKDTLGTDDYTTIASSYHMSAEKVKEQMTRSATLRNLRKSVVTTKAVKQPEAPVTAEEGQENEPSEEYASYVIGLAKDEWDANANTWAREDGPYREALRDYTISNDAATYAAAQAAYYVAQTQYAATEQQISSEWTDFVNERLSNATVQLSSLVA